MLVTDKLRSYGAAKAERGNLRLLPAGSEIFKQRRDPEHKNGNGKQGRKANAAHHPAHNVVLGRILLCRLSGVGPSMRQGANALDAERLHKRLNLGEHV